MNQTASVVQPLDRRRFNNPHAAIRAAGADAARKGLRVFHCPYRHPAPASAYSQPTLPLPGHTQIC
ncbi:CrpP family ICE-associated protein [Pseudomonas gingeri]